MKNRYLFPHKCKTLGAIISVPFAIIGVMLLVDSGGDLFGMDFWTLWGEFCPTIVIVGLTVGLLMAAFSRERTEDECITAIRSRSLVLAVILNSVIVIVGSCLLYDFDYLNFMSVNLFSVLLLYIVIFRIEIYRFLKVNRYEQ